MFKVDAIVRPDRLQEIEHELTQLGFSEFTVAEAQGHGGEPGPTGCYRGVKYEVPFVQQLRLELCVPATALEVVLERIVRAAHTGRPGDGRIFVSRVGEVIDIARDRTIYREEDAPVVRRRVAATADVGWQSGW